MTHLVLEITYHKTPRHYFSSLFFKCVPDCRNALGTVPQEINTRRDREYPPQSVREPAASNQDSKITYWKRRFLIYTDFIALKCFSSGGLRVFHDNIFCGGLESARICYLLLSGGGRALPTASMEDTDEVLEGMYGIIYFLYVQKLQSILRINYIN